MIRTCIERPRERGATCVVVDAAKPPWTYLLRSHGKLTAILGPGERRLWSGPEARRHWIGRLAAKLAVADLLHLPRDPDHLADIAILPHAEGRCHDPFKCAKGHPLRVELGNRARERIPPADHEVMVSITHVGSVAMALAAFASRKEQE